MAWPAGGDRKRLYAEAAVLSEHGDPIAVSRQTAAIVGPEWGVPLGLDSWT